MFVCVHLIFNVTNDHPRRTVMKRVHILSFWLSICRWLWPCMKGIAGFEISIRFHSFTSSYFEWYPHCTWQAMIVSISRLLWQLRPTRVWNARQSFFHVNVNVNAEVWTMHSGLASTRLRSDMDFDFYKCSIMLTAAISRISHNPFDYTLTVHAKQCELTMRSTYLLCLFIAFAACHMEFIAGTTECGQHGVRIEIWCCASFRREFYRREKNKFKNKFSDLWKNEYTNFTGLWEK